MGTEAPRSVREHIQESARLHARGSGPRPDPPNIVECRPMTSPPSRRPRARQLYWLLDASSSPVRVSASCHDALGCHQGDVVRCGMADLVSVDDVVQAFNALGEAPPILRPARGHRGEGAPCQSPLRPRPASGRRSSATAVRRGGPWRRLARRRLHGRQASAAPRAGQPSSAALVTPALRRDRSARRRVVERRVVNADRTNLGFFGGRLAGGMSALPGPSRPCGGCERTFPFCAPSSIDGRQS